MKSKRFKTTFFLLAALLFTYWGTQAQLVPSGGGNSNPGNETARIRPQSGQIYHIFARHSNLALDVAGGGTANGTGIIQWPLHGGPNQQFRLLDAGGGAFYIQSVSSGRVIDVDACRNDDGAKVQIWDKNGYGHQKFRFEQLPGGYYKIVNVCTGKVLDVSGASKENGQKIHSWKWWDGANQHFSLKPVSSQADNRNPKGIVYGQTYHLQNGYLNWGGGYLDVCNYANCGPNLYNVSCGSKKDRSKGSGTWKIVSAQGKSNGSVVMDGDKVWLINMYDGGKGGYLDVCGKVNCSRELFDCSTSPNGDRQGLRTSTWTIATLQSGPVEINEMVQFRTEYNQWWLQTCGHDKCGGNDYDVNVWPERNRVENVTHWRMIPAK